MRRAVTVRRRCVLHTQRLGRCLRRAFALALRLLWLLLLRLLLCWRVSRAGVRLVRRLIVLDRNGVTDQLFDGAEVRPFLAVAERHGRTGRAGAGGSPDAV